MKVRTGFVSNSSSSSFIVAFPHKPKDVNDVKKMLFGKGQYYSYPYHDYKYPTSLVAQKVWEDIQRNPAIDRSKYIKETYIHFASDKKYKWSILTQMNDRYRTVSPYMSATKFIEFISRPHIYEFEYSDNDGELYEAMEHGGLFDSLPHITIRNR